MSEFKKASVSLKQGEPDNGLPLYWREIQNPKYIYKVQKDWSEHSDEKYSLVALHNVNRWINPIDLKTFKKYLGNCSNGLEPVPPGSVITIKT
jgi:hypothetical protein